MNFISVFVLIQKSPVNAIPVTLGREVRGYYHLPKVNPQTSGGKELSYLSILDQLQAKSNHCPLLTKYRKNQTTFKIEFCCLFSRFDQIVLSFLREMWLLYQFVQRRFRLFPDLYRPILRLHPKMYQTLQRLHDYVRSQCHCHCRLAPLTKRNLPCQRSVTF